MYCHMCVRIVNMNCRIVSHSTDHTTTDLFIKYKIFKIKIQEIFFLKIFKNRLYFYIYLDFLQFSFYSILYNKKEELFTNFSKVGGYLTYRSHVKWGSM